MLFKLRSCECLNLDFCWNKELTRIALCSVQATGIFLLDNVSVALQNFADIVLLLIGN